MADDKHYEPGSFYRICDRTGFKVRAGRTRKEWTGRIVRDQSFEMRQPQDFVKGVVDYQAVPDPRPRQRDLFINQNPGTPAGKFEVYGDRSDVYGAEFLIQNQKGPAFNIGTFPGTRTNLGSSSSTSVNPTLTTEDETTSYVSEDGQSSYVSDSVVSVVTTSPGTALVQDLNGTIPAVTPAQLNQSLNRGPGSE